MSNTSEQSIPKLCDFGLSKLLSPSEVVDEPYGTIGYMAPEVIAQRDYNFSSDAWSFGVLIFVLLSGALPFDGPDQDTVMKLT